MAGAVTQKIQAKKERTGYTPPRYDDIFFEGQQWLDELAGSKLDPQEGKIIVADKVWKIRGELDVP